MTEALTVGDEESRSTSRKVMIPTTPIILSYLVENEKATRNDITKVVYSVSSKLRSTNVRVNAVFRGNLKNPDLGIESETVDSEICTGLQCLCGMHCKERRLAFKSTILISQRIS